MWVDMRTVALTLFGSGDPRLRALIWVVLGFALAALSDIVVRRILERVTDRTATKLDDAVVAACRRPAALSFVLVGAWYAVKALAPGVDSINLARGVLATIATLVWTTAGFRISSLVLNDLSEHHTKYSVVQPRTLPVFQIGGRSMVVAVAAYALLLAWRIDVTAWLASAGVIGIAVGFAAQETLANLFAGISIIVDAPYKLGDFLVLETGERGRVTDIGFRSTRLLTEDDIELILPNAVMAGARIKNESGGPAERERVHVPIGVAYGVDVDAVKAVLLEEVEGIDLFVRDDPKARPAVHLVNFGASSLDLVVKAWVHRPELRAPAIDRLNVAMYKRLTAEGVEIPFPKRDVYLYRQDTD
jgi:small-conductance mechanosensitive channel